MGSWHDLNALSSLILKLEYGEAKRILSVWLLPSGRRYDFDRFWRARLPPFKQPSLKGASSTAIFAADSRWWLQTVRMIEAKS